MENLIKEERYVDALVSLREQLEELLSKAAEAPLEEIRLEDVEMTTWESINFIFVLGGEVEVILSDSGEFNIEEDEYHQGVIKLLSENLKENGFNHNPEL